MKKAGKISLYILGLLFIGVLLLIIFRGPLISFFLKKVISERSNGKVELTLDSFHINLMDGRISVHHPSLLFTDFYLNESKSIRINEIVYHKIEINKLDIRSLIFDKEIVAGHFLLDKPEFRLTGQGAESKSDFHPDKLIEVLNQNPRIFSNIRIQVDDIQIHYGSVILSEPTTPDTNSGRVDFTIVLNHFDTRPDSTTQKNRFLFSDEFKLQLHHLYRNLRSGYTLKMDSGIFSSRNRHLVIEGASLFPADSMKEQNSIGIEAQRIVLNDIGLNEIRGIEDLHLRSVHLDDGVLINYSITHHRLQDQTGQMQGADILLKSLFDFTLDSISIHHVDYYNIQNHSDTLASVHNIDFLLTSILIDSSLFRDVFWNIHYDELMLNTGSFMVDRLLLGYRFSNSGLHYATGDQKLHIDSILLEEVVHESDEKGTRILIPSLSLEGFSAKKLQKRKKQHLRIKLTNPEGTLHLTSSSPEKVQKKKTLFPDYLLLDEVALANGNLHLVDDSGWRAEVTGLNLALNGLHLPETNHDKMRFNHLRMDYDRCNAQLESKSLRIATGYTRYGSGNLWLQNLHISQNGVGGNNLVTAKVVQVSGFDRERMMATQEIYADRMFISSPILKSRFIPEGKNRQQNKKSWTEVTSPLTLAVNELVVENGKIQSTLMMVNDPVTINAGYQLNLDGIKVMKNDTLTNIAKEVDWIIRLNDLDAETVHHHLQLKELLSDSRSAVLQLKQLDVSGTPDTTAGGSVFLARSVHIPLIDLSGLDYQLLLHHDSLDFQSVRIEQPSVDLLLTKNNEKASGPSGKSFLPEDYLVFNYDSVMLEKLHLNIEKKDDSTTEFISLKEFNFSHLKNKHNQDNLITDLVLNFDEFSFHENNNRSFLHIRKGYLDNRKNFLLLENVHGSNLSHSACENDQHKKSGICFEAEKIGLSGLVMAEILPTRINAEELEITHLDMDIYRKQADEKVKTEFRLDLEPLKKFDKLFTSLQLNTAHMNDITFQIHSMRDTMVERIMFDSIGLVIQKIRIDTSMYHQKKPEIIQQLSVDLKGRTRISADSLYEMQAGKLHYNFHDQRITIDSLYATPLFAPEEFFRRAKYQTDRIQFFGRQVDIEGIDLAELANDNHIHISDLELKQFMAEIYRDKHYPLKHDLYKPLPKELLMNIPRSFTIDSAHITNGYLKYKEMESKADEPGEVFFDNFNITAYNITNHLQEDEKKDLIIDLNARIMGKAGMYLNLHFPLYPDTVAFTLTGETEKIDLTTLNPLTTNLLGLGIVKGTGSADISYIFGNDSIAKGSLIFRYRKLRLLPYSRKKEKLRKGALSPLYSFMINDLVVKSNNPKFARKPRVGQVYFRRDTQKSVINYVWKSVLSGLMSTLGFNNKEQRQDRKDIRKEKN